MDVNSSSDSKDSNKRFDILLLVHFKRVIAELFNPLIKAVNKLKLPNSLRA